MRLAPLLCLLPLLSCSGADKGGRVPTTTEDSGTAAGTPPGSTTPGTPTGGTVIVGSGPLQFYDTVPTNVLFLSIDTMRKDHLGVHSTLGLTPFMDTIAAEGVVLEDHLQCSNWTYASTTCTLAGRTNIERGHIPRLNGTVQNRPPVPDGTPFLATWLGEAGYYSAVVSANDWLSSNWGNTQGYVDEALPGGNALFVASKGIELVQEAQANGVADKWFLHLHHMEPHAAYQPLEHHIVGQDQLDPWPEDLTNRNIHYSARDSWPQMSPEDQDLLEAHLRVLYEAEIRTLDERFAANWANYEAAGLLDDTLVVIWNDHGEAFWEHGFQTHAYNLVGEENDGFAVFWAKNMVPGTWDEPTAAIDLVPTVLELLELPIPPEVTGLPVGSAPPDRPIFTEALARTGGVQAVVQSGYKLHYNWADASVRYFDRNADPLELVDLYDPADPNVLALWDLLRPQVEAMAPLVVNGQPSPNWPPDLP